MFTVEVVDASKCMTINFYPSLAVKGRTGITHLSVLTIMNIHKLGVCLLRFFLMFYLFIFVEGSGGGGIINRLDIPE